MKQETLKIMIAGDGGVGKTTLILRYVENRFNENTKLTIGVDFFLKKLKIKNTYIKLQIWDLGGQDRFQFLHESYVNGSVGALMVVDLTRRGSLENISKWVSVLRKTNKTSPILLVGAKLDLTEEIQIYDNDLEKIKERYNFFDYIKNSSKTNKNVNQSFEILLDKILKTIKIN